MANTTDPPYLYINSVDVFLGAVLSLCFLMGTLGNMLSFAYFKSCRRDLPTTIYIIMTVVDFVTSFTLFPVISEFFNERHGMLAQHTSICHTWGFIWSFLPYMSVFLVLVLSTIRTISLLSPFTHISIRTPVILCTLYGTFLILRVAVTLGLGYFEFQYWAPEVHCMENTTQRLYEMEDTYKAIVGFKVLLNLFCLAAPLLPVVISAVLSCRVVWVSRRACQKQNQLNGNSPRDSTFRMITKRLRNRQSTGTIPPTNGDTLPSSTATKSPKNTPKSQKSVQIRATVTILVVTFTYIIFNVPVFMVYVAFTVHYAKNWTLEFFSTEFATNYLWIIVYVVLVALNAACNPLVYFWRVKRMRKFYYKKFIYVKMVMSGKPAVDHPTRMTSVFSEGAGC